MRVLVPVCAAVALTLASQGAAATFFVATNGSNANPGTEAKPFATLERARDVIRQLRANGPLPTGGITVELCGGIHDRSQPFDLTERDSGTENAPVVYQALKGESVRITGGRVVAGWKQVTDAAVPARLDESARGKVWQADLRAQGVTDFGDVAASGRRLEWPICGRCGQANPVTATPVSFGDLGVSYRTSRFLLDQ